MGFKIFTVVEMLSNAFRQNSDKQSGQISVNIVDTSGVPVKFAEKFEDRVGSDCSGADGATGRVLTLQNISESGAPNSVWVEDQIIASSDVTFNHLSSSSTLTFDNIEIFDTDAIRVKYYV